MIRLILFDYDGVIVDSFPTVYAVYRIICNKIGVKCPETFEEFRKTYGYSYKELHRNVGIRPEDEAKVERIFKEEIIKQKPPIFQGIKEVIKELSKNYILVVISSTYASEVIAKLKGFGIYGCFKTVFAKENEYPEPFKKTVAIPLAMDEFKAKPEETIFVGDRNVDYDQATKAGLKNIILAEYGWGYDPAKIPWQNKELKVKKPEDILIAVKSFN